jgi:hypothetical protein
MNIRVNRAVASISSTNGASATETHFKSHLSPSFVESGWVAQVSFLRPGFSVMRVSIVAAEAVPFQDCSSHTQRYIDPFAASRCTSRPAISMVALETPSTSPSACTAIGGS